MATSRNCIASTPDILGYVNLISNQEVLKAAPHHPQQDGQTGFNHIRLSQLVRARYCVTAELFAHMSTVITFREKPSPGDSGDSKKGSSSFTTAVDDAPPLGKPRAERRYFWHEKPVFDPDAIATQVRRIGSGNPLLSFGIRQCVYSPTR